MFSSEIKMCPVSFKSVWTIKVFVGHRKEKGTQLNDWNHGSFCPQSGEAAFIFLEFVFFIFSILLHYATSDNLVKNIPHIFTVLLNNFKEL